MSRTYLLTPNTSAGEQAVVAAGLSCGNTTVITRGDQLRRLSGITLHQVGGTLPLDLSDEVLHAERSGRVRVVDGLPAAPSPELNPAMQTIIDLMQHFGGQVDANWSSYRVRLGCRGSSVSGHTTGTCNYTATCRALSTFMSAAGSRTPRCSSST